MSEGNRSSTRKSQLSPSYDPLPVYSPSISYDAARGGHPESDQERTSGLLEFDAITQSRDSPHNRIDSLKLRTVSSFQSVAKSTTKLSKQLWADRAHFPVKKQLYALILLSIFGIAPFATVATITSDDGYSAPFTTAWEPKTLYCGDFQGEPQNSTKSGIEGLFVLDATFGRFPFSQVKLIDVLWDLVLGRGLQLIAWWVSYKVFTDVLLNIIERHATTYRTFMRIGLEGPSLGSLMALAKDLFRVRSKRTGALFFYMLISIAYVLSIPVLLGAMTGYDATQISWIDLEDDNQIIPTSNLHQDWVILGTRNETFSHPMCSKNITETMSDYSTFASLREARGCRCEQPDGNITTMEEWSRHFLGFFDTGRFLEFNGTHMEYYYSDCNPYFKGNNGTFYKYGPPAPGEDPDENPLLHCNETLWVTVDDKKYDAFYLRDADWGYCFNGKGYLSGSVYGKTRCLPDTSDEAYQWGFSSMLSAIFVILQFTWCMTMYIVWQDAQINSKLVKSGFSLTQLRAAFTLATAARWKTGFVDEQLVGKSKEELDIELFGSKKKKQEGAEVSREIFQDPGTGDSSKGFRRRNIQHDDDDTSEA